MSTISSTRRKRTKKKTPKYIFIVGGVMSGVGKGIASSSIATCLQARGLSVTAMKIDPYINVDAGTLNPTEHGEVFVLREGLETDQDMGNYERFLNMDLPADNYMTTGSVYQSVIERERNLGYKGRNVQVVPDIPAEVIRRIKVAQEKAAADVVQIEVGGTVGEYENILFIEAIRMLKQECPDDVAVVMVSYLPVPGSVGEMKTKPTQHAVRALGATGVFPDMIIARSPEAIDDKRKEKLARLCGVRADHIIAAPDVESIYDIPLQFDEANVATRLCRQLGLQCQRDADLVDWRRFVQRSKSATKPVLIAVVGKYFTSGDFILSDVYLSILEAIKYSAYHLNLQPEITYLSAQDFTDKKHCKKLRDFDGILVPGGFGTTGVEGKLNVIEYARTNRIPYFGICYGMQLLVLEYARNVLGLSDASTEEINPNATDLIVSVQETQKENLANAQYGGTMRLGVYEAVLQKGSTIAKAYKTTKITERHRHRYEINNDYVVKLLAAGLVFSGTSPDGHLVEVAELPAEKHPFFVGVQYHPELKARPLNPHPLFTAFVKAARAQDAARKTSTK